MKFESQTSIEATKEDIWALLFDVSRVATLIPGCSDVEELRPLESYSAKIRQKVGPFRFNMPCDITVDEYAELQKVGITAQGEDKKTATSAIVKMVLSLDADEDGKTLIDIDADIQMFGKLATLGAPIVKRKCKSIFKEFDENLHEELEDIGETKSI